VYTQIQKNVAQSYAIPPTGQPNPIQLQNATNAPNQKQPTHNHKGKKTNAKRKESIKSISSRDLLPKDQKDMSRGDQIEDK